MFDDRIHQHDILAQFGVSAAPNLNKVVILLRGHTADHLALREGIDKDLVGDDVQLLLFLALHVAVARFAQYVGDTRFVDEAVHHLGGDLDTADQAGEFAR